MNSNLSKMYQHELYRVLNTLKPSEIREFKLFLNSPYHNTDETLIQYVQLLLNKKGYLLKELPSDAMLVGLLPGKMVKSKKDIYNCRNRLLALLEEYLILKHRKNNSFQNQLTLAKHYRNYGLRVRYMRTMRKTTKDLKSEKIQNADYLQQCFALQKLDFEDPYQSIVRKDDRRIESVMIALDQFYLTEKMKYATEMINRQQLLQTQYHEIIPAAQLPIQLNSSYPGILNLYLSVFAMFNKPEDELAFHHFEQLLTRYRQNLSTAEKGSFYLYAINICIRHLNQGKHDFIDHYLRLIDRMEKENVLLQDGVMNPWVYKNAVQLYLRKSQPEKALRFLEKYKDHIPDSHRESVVVLAKAQVAFALKNYEEIFYLTNQLRYMDFHLVVGLKLLACKAHLELDHRVRLEGELEAFGKYLRYHAKQLGTDRVKMVDAFISMLKRINHLQPGDKNSIKALYLQVKEKKNIAESAWLLSYLEEQANNSNRKKHRSR